MKIEKKTLLAFIEAVGALAPECRVWLKNDGMETRAVDTANVALVSAKLPKGAFSEYDNGGKVDVMGLDISKMKTALKILADDRDVTLTLNGNRLQLGDGRYDYGNALLDVNTIRKDPNPPNIALPACIVLDAKELTEAIKAMTHISDKVVIAVPEDGTLTLSAEGDTDKLTKDLTGRAVRSPGDKVLAAFSLDYLNDMAKVIKQAQGEVTVSLNTDHPVKFEFAIEDVAVEYLLAPRIEAD